MYKTGISLAFGSLLLSIPVGSSSAATHETREPLGHAQESIDKNLQKNPDNKGLQNAAGRLQVNQERIEKKRVVQKSKRRAKKIVAVKKPPKQSDKASEREKKPTQQERMERMERIEHPGKMERPNR